MITALFVFDPKGDILLSKLFKDGVKRNISDVFRIQVIAANSKTSTRDIRLPVLTLGSTSFIYIRTGRLWMTAVTRSNQDCAVVLEFLYNLEDLIKQMLGGVKELTEEMFAGNFSMIYELLDEAVDFGYPTSLEPTTLKEVMLSEQKDKFKLTKKTETKRTKTTLDPGSVTWRAPGIKYRRNEIFLNVEEKITVLMNEQLEVLRAYVDGNIQMKTHLSGMPECRFGLSDGPTDEHEELAAAYLRDSKFHQCVDLTKFDMHQVIQFVPPDGEFQLMLYHCDLNVHLPFKVYPQVQEMGRSKLSYKIRLKSCYPAKIPASNVVLRIPTPKGVIRSLSLSSLGKTKFSTEDGMFVWKFNKLFGNQEHFFTGEVELGTNTNDSFNAIPSNAVINWARPPIKVDFVLDMFSCSGLTVKYLRVNEKSNYRTVKWVKYQSQAGSYDVRF